MHFIVPHLTRPDPWPSFLIGVWLISVFAQAQVEGLCCGSVFFGTGNHTNHTTRDFIAAYWVDFDCALEKNRIRPPHPDVFYQVAVISENIATLAINSSGSDKPASERCRHDSGLRAGVKPDVVPFVWVGRETAYVNRSVALRCDTLYFVIVRAQDEHSVLYSNTVAFSSPRHFCDDDDDDALLPQWQIGLVSMAATAICVVCVIGVLTVFGYLRRARPKT